MPLPSGSLVPAGHTKSGIPVQIPGVKRSSVPSGHTKSGGVTQFCVSSSNSEPVGQSGVISHSSVVGLKSVPSGHIGRVSH